jgi:hypothetical protein
LNQWFPNVVANDAYWMTIPTTPLSGNGVNTPSRGPDCAIVEKPGGKFAELHFDDFSRFGLEDFDLGIPGVDFLLKPLARVFIAVAQEDSVRGNLADEIQKFVAVGVGGEVELLKLALPGDFPGAPAENEAGDAAR